MSSKQELIDKQPRFWGLIAGGSTLTAACEAVRVHRATGRKWRLAAGGRIPRKRPVPSGRYLSLEERLQIADLYLGGDAGGPELSTRRCTSRAEAIYVLTCIDTCGPGVRSGAREGPRSRNGAR